MVVNTMLNFLLLLVVAAERSCCHATEYPELQEITLDMGENITLPCSDGSSPEPGLSDPNSVMWVREGRADDVISRSHVGIDGELSLSSLDREDAGIYSCTIEGDHEVNDGVDSVRTRIRINVRVPPRALANVTIHPSTVLALLLWEVEDDGGYPIDHFTALYREKYSDSKDWHSVVPEHISPNARQIDVYHLDPNTTYVFKIWAVNQLGAGVVSWLEATTLHNIEEMELARHLLDGAENFDTRVWVAAVAVVMGTLVMLAFGTCYLLYKECHVPPRLTVHREEQEIIELVPNIILNPGYYDDGARMIHVEPDENSNDQTTTRLNNNTIVQPMRV